MILITLSWSPSVVCSVHCSARYGCLARFSCAAQSINLMRYSAAPLMTVTVRLNPERDDLSHTISC